jgi:hypothetical protein
MSSEGSAGKTLAYELAEIEGRRQRVHGVAEMRSNVNRE